MPNIENIPGQDLPGGELVLVGRAKDKKKSYPTEENLPFDNPANYYKIEELVNLEGLEGEPDFDGYFDDEDAD